MLSWPSVRGFSTRARAHVGRVVKMVATTPAPTASRTFQDQLGAAGAGAAIAAATAAVNAAVSMREIEAPSAERSFVYLDGAADGRKGVVDEVGLPLVYDQQLIKQYWESQSNALSSRWAEFLQVSVPFLTRVFSIVIGSGSGELKVQAASLAKDARERMERLGPTYIKLGQMMSVRPDVLPEAALAELKILQDNVKGFDTPTAIAVIEGELGGPLVDFFAEISEEPVAAASLAQVYKARLHSGEIVAIKVQRPKILEQVSKDLYVLRRAAEVYQGLVDRFAPQQRTNYVALLNEWAVGFYTELDFKNEAANQIRMKEVLEEAGCSNLVYVPKVFPELSTRRVLVTEWVEGTKLGACGPEEIRELIPAAQEVFLVQMLQAGFMHADPHPGNFHRIANPTPGGPRLALLDFGLVARLKQGDMDTMISAVIHLANRDYPSLVNDFINLNILPADCDRPKVIPLMDKALTPYVKGGGAVKYEAELRKTYGLDGSVRGSAGGFAAMTQDALTVLNDIPFSIPPYFALLGRAIVTLEGIALSGDPNYGIILEAYPFVARKLLREDRPAIQKALMEVLYSGAGAGGGSGSMSASRLIALLDNALSSDNPSLAQSRAAGGGALIDLDGGFATSSGSVGGQNDGEVLAKRVSSPGKSLRLLLGPSGKSLRALLLDEAVVALDLLLRQNTRKVTLELFARSSLSVPSIPFLPSLPSFLSRGPLSLIAGGAKPQDLPLPFLLPTGTETGTGGGTGGRGGARVVPVSPLDFPSLSSLSSLSSQLRPVIATPAQLLDALAPLLTREEELYALALTDAAVGLLGGEGEGEGEGDAAASATASAPAQTTQPSAPTVSKADIRALFAGDVWQEPRGVFRALLAFVSTGVLPLPLPLGLALPVSESGSGRAGTGSGSEMGQGAAQWVTVLRSMLGSGSGSGSSSGSSSGRSSGSDKGSPHSEPLLSALASLTASERLELEAFTGAVSLKLRQRLVGRLSVLK